MVRTGKSGSGMPLHVCHSTLPSDPKALCYYIACVDSASVAHAEIDVSYLCEHLKSTASCQLPSFAPLALDQLLDMNFTEKMKEKIQSYADNDKASKSPIVVLFHNKEIETVPSYLYYSVFDPHTSSNSPLMRLVVSFNTTMRVFTCPCNTKGRSCIHIMICRVYTAQI